MPKPKNDGTMLNVRVPQDTHVAIAGIQGFLIGLGERPGLVTKARVVELAVRHYRATFPASLSEVIQALDE